MPARSPWLAFDVLGFVLFVLSGAVQFNDPDPLPWVAVYATAALLCAWAALGRFGRASTLLALAVATTAFVWAATLAPSAVAFLRSERQAVAFTMKTGDLLEEEARESGGLVLVTLWSAILGMRGRRRATPPG